MRLSNTRRWPSGIATLAIIIGICLLLSPPVQAQFETAAVLGTVRDQNGAVLQGARVTLRNPATGISATSTTDGDGDYSFPSVKIGTYRVTAELQGFSTGAVEKVTVTVEARQRVDVTLQVGATSDVVTVTGEAPLLETESSSKGQIISEKQLINLPILGRNYSSLALLTPGVRQSQSGNQGDISFRREGAYNVNGLRSVYNNFLLDGIDNNFYGTTNQGFSNQAVQPSPDFVAEFRMSVNTYSAEYGRTTGAVMNVSTRSGTNEFHGRLWNYVQNTSLNAAGFFRPAGAPEGVCQACHPLCGAQGCLAYGPGTDACLACRFASEQGQCVVNCSSTRFLNSGGLCQDCPAECAGGCTGPNPTT
ncbi:MAG: carboxypeptidase regulatory-like domain-containing protein, partial [Blastocatellia bacterium]